MSPSFSVDETFFYSPKILNPLGNKVELIGSSIMAFFAWLSGSIPNAFIIADFIFPAIISLSLFWLVKNWLKDDFKAAAAAVSILVFYHYLTYFPYLPSVIKLLINYWQNGSYWPIIRSFHPQISLGVFFLFAAVLWKRSSWQLTTLMLILITYTYFFYWTVAVTWIVWFRFSRKLIKILAAWALFSIPYWLSIIPLLPEKDYWQRNYFYQLPTINQWLMLFFGLGLTLLINNRLQRKFWLTFYASIFSLIVITISIKFGADDPIGHWFLRVVNPMTAVIFFVILFNKVKLSKFILIGTTILLLFFQFRLHFLYFKNNANAFTISSEKLEAFHWLKQNTPKYSIVATPSLGDSLYLPAYTNTRPYLKHAQLRPAENSELLQRLLEVYKIARWDSERLTMMFLDNQKLIAKKRFDFDQCAGHFLFFRLYNGANYYSCTVPKPVLDEILEQYQKIPTRFTYPVDYWLGTDYLDFGKLLWENKTYKIYALR